MPDGFTFAFTIAHHIPPPPLRRTETPEGPALPANALGRWLLAEFDRMAAGEGSSMFLPRAYWVARGHFGEEPSFDWQRVKIKKEFARWKKRQGESHQDKTLLTRACDEGTDPEFDAQAGLRCWLARDLTTSPPKTSVGAAP